MCVTSLTPLFSFDRPERERLRFETTKRLRKIEGRMKTSAGFGFLRNIANSTAVFCMGDYRKTICCFDMPPVNSV
jgi:hypothetical protein